MVLRQNLIVIGRIWYKITSVYKTIWPPTLFTPNFQYFYTDISAISVTFCNSVCNGPSYKTPVCWLQHLMVIVRLFFWQTIISSKWNHLKIKNDNLTSSANVKMKDQGVDHLGESIKLKDQDGKWQIKLIKLKWSNLKIRTANGWSNWSD